MADIDIFLLQEEDQETDKDKLYTKEEIRLQLENTLAKMLRVLMASGVDIDKVLPLKDWTMQTTIHTPNSSMTSQQLTRLIKSANSLEARITELFTTGKLTQISAIALFDYFGHEVNEKSVARALTNLFNKGVLVKGDKVVNRNGITVTQYRLPQGQQRLMI